MRDFQNHQMTLFSGEFVPEGYRGRRSQPGTKTSTIRWSAVVFGILLFGATTAATAVTVQRYSKAPQTSLVGHSLPANMMRSPYLGGIEVALY